jgi:hypothetical protein
METHTLGAGTTVAQKYKRLGVSSRRAAVRPRHLFGLLVGKPASGKTSLLATCSDALIINTDLSSVPTSHASAAFYPWINEQGQCVDPNGNPFTLTWDDCLATQQTFLDMKSGGQPVPDMVVIDSLAGTIPLVRDYTTKRFGKKEWREVDGRAGWDALYQSIIDYAQVFRKAGVGFYFTCHVVDQTIPLGDDRFVIQPELTITSSFWKRLFWQFELVAAVVAEWQTDTYTEDKPGPVIAGKQTTQTVTKTRKVRRHLLTTNREELAGITKGRINLADFEIPNAPDAWDLFEVAYMEAANGS